MTNNESFYECMLLSIDQDNEDEFLKRKLLIELIKDVYNGYENYFFIDKILKACNVEYSTWESIIFAYSSFFKYKSLSEKEISKESLSN